MDGEEKMKFYKTDWFMKLASLVAAIAIWFYVVYQENPMYSRWVPNIAIVQHNRSVDFENGKLVIVSISAEDTDVKINGRRRLISSIDASSAQARIDMSNVTDAGEYNLPVKVEFTIDGADVVEIKPNYCTVIVDRVVTEERKINVITEGKVKDGYIVDDIVINPDTVKLTGPQSIINNVKNCNITVDLTGSSEDIKGLYKIKLYDERGQEITDASISKNIEYTDVYCSVSATKDIRVLPSMDGEVNSNNEKITAVCTPEYITVKGKTTVLNEITEIFTEPIDVSYVYETTETEQNLRLPDGLFFADENDKTVKIKLTVEKTEDTE